MNEFNEETATAEELWNWCQLEYKSQNRISQYLYNNFFSKLKQITALLGADDKVLEVGCGAGVSSLKIKEMLKTQSFEVSDVDERYIQMLKKTGFPIPFQRESALSLNREDKTLDCIILLEVLEHIDQYEHALAELFRVARKTIVISVPNEPLWRILNMGRGKYWKAWGNTPGHINHWSRHSFTQLLSGFGVIKQVYLPIPWILMAIEVK